MATHREIRRFFYSEDMIEITDFLLKRYEPTNLSKLDILRVIYPTIIKLYKLDIEEQEFKQEVVKKIDIEIIQYVLLLRGNKESFNVLYKKWKSGNEKDFLNLLKKASHLIWLELIDLEYENPFSEELFQEGIIILINLIKKYKISYKSPFNVYLTHGLKTRLITVINKYKRFENDMNINYIISNTSSVNYMDDNCIKYDNVNEFVNKSELVLIKNILFKTSYLSFLEKTTVMAKFGFINNFSISYSNLAKYFGCLPQNINQIGLNALSKIKKLQYDEKYCLKYKAKVASNYSLFEYFSSDKRIVLICMSNLSSEQVELLKYVWGEDFYNLKKLEDIDFTEEQVVLYYKAIATIYKSIKILIDDFKNNKIGYENFIDEGKEEVQVKK